MVELGTTAVMTTPKLATGSAVGTTHRINSSVSATTFASVFGLIPVAPQALHSPSLAAAARENHYIRVSAAGDSFSRSNVRFSKQSVQAQFADFAREARLARFSGLGVSKAAPKKEERSTLLYQFAANDVAKGGEPQQFAALRVTQPAFGQDIAMDVVHYRQAPQLNQRLSLTKTVLHDVPRLDQGHAVPTAPNLVRFGDGTTVATSATTVTTRPVSPIMTSMLQVFKGWFNQLPGRAKDLLSQTGQMTVSAMGKSVETGWLAHLMNPTVAPHPITGAIVPVQQVTAMQFGHNMVEIITPKAQAIAAQTFSSLKEASAGVLAMTNQIEQSLGLSRLADKTVMTVANANRAKVGANPYATSPFSRNPFSSVRFSGAPPNSMPPKVEVTS